jgi:hypothetical protein
MPLLGPTKIAGMTAASLGNTADHMLATVVVDTHIEHCQNLDNKSGAHTTCRKCP